MIYRYSFISFCVIVSILLSVIQPLYAAAQSCEEPYGCGSGGGYVRTVSKHSSRIFPTYATKKHSLRNETAALNCNIDANCAVLDQAYDFINAQIGILFYEGGIRYKGVDIHTIFFPLHSEIAVAVNGNIPFQYGSDIWQTEQKLFWIKVSATTSPMLLQTDFNGFPDSCDNCRAYIVRNIFYRQAGVDYSSYLDNASRSMLEIFVDTDNRVISHEVIVYDDDDNIIERRQLASGDEVQIVYSGDSPLQPEVDFIYSMEDFVEVAQAPEFFYDYYIPGEDFSCSLCTKSFDDMALYFRLEADTSTSDKVSFSWSERRYIGQVERLRSSADTASNGTTYVGPIIESLSANYAAKQTIAYIEKSDNFELTPGLLIPAAQRGKQAIFFSSAILDDQIYPLLSKQMTLSDKLTENLFKGSLGDYSGSIDIIQEYILLDSPDKRYGNAFRLEVGN